MSRTSLGVLPCLARQQTTLPISPTNLPITVSAKLWQAIVTFTRMEDAEEVSASCPNEKMTLQIIVDIRRNTMPNMLQRCQSCKKYGQNFQDMIH
jgi:hypothetical protein